MRAGEPRRRRARYSCMMMKRRAGALGVSDVGGTMRGRSESGVPPTESADRTVQLYREYIYTALSDFRLRLRLVSDSLEPPTTSVRDLRQQTNK